MGHTQVVQGVRRAGVLLASGAVPSAAPARRGDPPVTRTSGRVRITVEAPTSIIDGAPDAAAVLDLLWARLPAFEGNNAFCLLDDDGGLFLKGQRYRPGYGMSGLRQAGRLLREVANLAAMRGAGLPVPEVVLHGAEIRFLLPTRSLLVLRRVPSCVTLRDLIASSQEADRRGVWDPLGRVVAAMHALAIFHRDLTARNVLVQQGMGGDSARIVLIDCPRAAIVPPSVQRGYMRRTDLFHLSRSILFAGGTEDEVRSLLGVCGFDRADDLLAMVRRSLGAGGARPMRTKVWVAFGV